MREAKFMSRAITLAMRGRPHTAPNPCVGAVLVHNDVIVAEGYHTACGKPHAEVEALRDAKTKGITPSHCTLYVTLEPCNHHGKTPPCTKAILDAGIKRVVVGCKDPNASVQGGGFEFLRQHGVQVDVGVKEQECLDLIADFMVWQRTKRPFSILKLATTLDGRIATSSGHSAWISNEKSRREVHRLRSWCDAIIVGGGTFRADNPALTCRLKGYTGTQPVAVVVSGNLPDRFDYELLVERPSETIFWTTEAESRSSRSSQLTELGCTVWGLPPASDGLDLHAGFELLRRERSCHYTLTEGGGRLAGSLRQQGLIDEFWLFQALKVLGDAQAKPAFAGRSVESMQDCWQFRLLERRFLDSDLFMRLRSKE